ncbi:caspase domain-containing protein [uncultured Bradyrhizobium sp.]|uniref:caspase family protein n=1 Tax=uncultured Bradyrhizobium sp. TaxID=199684 RepID=UPI0035C9E6F5
MPRFALIIGNASYKYAKLKTPRRDTLALAKKLRELNFQVEHRLNVSKDDFENSLVEFEEKIESAEVALFFFAGHGFQINGKNYLAPVNADVKREGRLTWRAIELTKILEGMSRRAQTSLIFLDACRDSPLFRRWIAEVEPSHLTRDFQSGNGLARIGNIKRLSNTFVAFATEPGGLARDSVDGKHSPFVAALLPLVAERGLSISDLMILVRTAVMKATNDEQIPWEESSLLRPFYFNPGDRIEQHRFSELLREGATPLDVDEFLQKHPQTEYRADALARLEVLLATCTNVTELEKFTIKMLVPACSERAVHRLATVLWPSYKRETDIERIRRFVHRFPEFKLGKELLAWLTYKRLGKTRSDVDVAWNFERTFDGTAAARRARRRRLALLQIQQLKRRFYRAGSLLRSPAIFPIFRLPRKAATFGLSAIRAMTLAVSFVGLVFWIGVILKLPFFDQLPDDAVSTGGFGIAMIIGVLAWALRRRSAPFEASTHYCAIALNLLFVIPSFDKLNLRIPGLTTFQTAASIWTVVVLVAGTISFIQRAGSISFFTATLYGLTLGFALSLLSKQFFSVGAEIFLPVTLFACWLGQWLARAKPRHINDDP